MPLYDFECVACDKLFEDIAPVGGEVTCPTCGRGAKRLPPLVAIVIAGNMGPKLKNRVALDTELRKQGFEAPLFKSEDHKDKARWLMKKHSAPWR